jgi:hypothetical protein
MTLILATKDTVYGDLKVVADTGEKCDNLCKVVSNDFLAAGFAGDFETIIESIRLVEAGETDPKVIAKTGVEGLIVKDERIYLLDCRKVWKRPKKELYFGCGTGSSAALAFLSGRLSAKPKGKLTEEDISAAFKFVGRSRDDCSVKFASVCAP